MLTPLQRWTVCMLLATAMVVGSGCRTTPKEEKLDFSPVLTRLFIEAGGDVAGIPVQLPLSGTQVMVNPKPVFGEFDIMRAEVVRVDIGLCVYLQLTPDATRDFYRFSLLNRGRRIVVTLNSAALGARLIEQPVSNGTLFFFLELPDSQLPELVENINRTSQAMAKEAARARK